MSAIAPLASLARGSSARRAAFAAAASAPVPAPTTAGVAGAPPPAPAFVDVAGAAGVAQPHGLREFHNPYAAVMAGYTALGAAVAVADFDGDGREDLFVTESAEAGKNRLYRNLGGMRFVDVAATAGVANGNDAGNASADAVFLDYDNDGRADLLVVRFGRNQLFHNEGGGRFREVSREAGLDRYANGITAIAFDYDRDGRLDIAVGNYFQPVNVFAPDTPRFFPESFETASNGGGVTLWRNDGPGPGGRVTFTDVTDKAGLRQSGWTLDLGAGDADNDGDLDLYVACDFGTDRFFLNDGDGTFSDRTAAAIGIDTKKGMNAEWGEFDGEAGSTLRHQHHRRLHAQGKLPVAQRLVSLRRAAERARPGHLLRPRRRDRHPRYRLGLGAKFLDYDNDGWLDLYALNGWVSAGPESYVPDVFAMILRVSEHKGGDFSDARDWPPMGGKSLSGYQKKRLFHNEGGQVFSEQAARHGLDSTRDGRGLAVADLDEDGRVDLFVANAGAPPHLFHNLWPRGPHWVQLTLAWTRSIATPSLRCACRRWPHAAAFSDPGNGFAAQGTRRLHSGSARPPRSTAPRCGGPRGCGRCLPASPDRAARVWRGGRGRAVRQRVPAS